MDYHDLQTTIDSSPALRLLRSPHAAMIIAFFYRQFKERQVLTIPNSVLVEDLRDFLDEFEGEAAEAYVQSPQSYLDIWCDEHHRFLRKYYESKSDDPVFELTPETEKVIQWMEDLGRREFVGTESRFLRIFELLEEIISSSTDNPEARLLLLEAQKAALEREMETIRRTGEVETFTATQIKERFIEANRLARTLLADFREVEQNFKQITRRVQEDQLQDHAVKGEILGFVLDADDLLKTSDQGRSFYAFWKFLLSPEKQRELEELIDQVHQLPEVHALKEENRTLRRIKVHLLEAGEKVIQSNRRLAEQLRRLLDEQSFLENRRVMEYIAEIKKRALVLVDDPPVRKDFLLLDDRPDIESVMERPLWSPADRPDFTEIAPELAADEAGEVDFGDLFNRFAINTDELRRRISQTLVNQSQISLSELTTRYPVEAGLSELVAYFSIAGANDRHVINDEVKERIHFLDTTGRPRVITVPQVIFTR